ncbi:hypothetical protein [Prochlorococcus marinus]|nr:hypothetical protein [Prochlorococcus marinus]
MNSLLPKKTAVTPCILALAVAGAFYFFNDFHIRLNGIRYLAPT